MRFVDEAIIQVKAGNGGRGCVSFRREKYVPRGGPDGGDGGDGGDVILAAEPSLLSLYDFRLKRSYEARNGQPGQGSQCNGRNGEDLVLGLPVGTLVFRREEEAWVPVEDLSVAGKRVVIARGGRGGKGNEHFKSSTMRAPRFAQPGEPGEECRLRLELKMLADAAIVGFPNAGKSTLISRLSAARPKIADYPFTTLTPNLGVMVDEDDPDRRMVIADVPGLIEGAHLGGGLGHRFLRHVERSRFLVHVLGVQDLDDDDPWAGFEMINEELRRFDETLASRQQIEVVNKIDLLDGDRLDRLKDLADAEGRDVLFVSAKEGAGLAELRERMWKLHVEVDFHAPLLHSLPLDGGEETPDAGKEFDVDVEYV
ncbi:MAG: GTPase ObgE [Desulfovibrio sp.]|jgi:GTP-binding protein|nr:GTPase ObgE [Desulfovibrio sp.]